MTSALDDGSLAAGFPWQGTWFNSLVDFGIDAIGPDANDFTNFFFWGYALNFVTVEQGGCHVRVQPGDEVLFAYDVFSKAHLLKLTGPATAIANHPVFVTVTDGKSGLPVGGAQVGNTTSRLDGRARVVFDSPGQKTLKAEATNSIRSNRLSICVAPPDSAACAGTSQPSGGEGPASDLIAPLIRISSPRNGKRYRRGPRLLRGTASDGGGVRTIKLALRRSGRRKGCSWWSGSRERFVRGGCGKASFFSIDGVASWSYLMPKRRARGRYRLDVTAVDRAGNTASEFRRGRNRVSFQVRR